MAKIPLLKVVVAGDGAVGKTSLIRQFSEGKFESSRVMTIGVDFQTQTVELPTGTVKLSIWDMAGQARFQSMRSGFYRGSRAAALVYDVTRPESLANLARWRDEILAVVEQQPFVVVGNKIDLERAPQVERAPAYAASIGARHLETSALTAQGVRALFQTLAQLAVDAVA
ncbi:MAG: Rab family GTPase [Anaerolineales bacterium]